jgi:hypothetical protein
MLAHALWQRPSTQAFERHSLSDAHSLPGSSLARITSPQAQRPPPEWSSAQLKVAPSG